MFKILILFLATFLCAGPVLADEITLDYGQAPDRPVMYEHFEIYEEDEEAWEEGAGLLTGRAVSLYAYFPIEGMDDGLVCAYDFSSEDAAKPDIFYADVNFNLALDEGEKFSLAPTRTPGNDFPPGTDFPLCAEKISLAAVAKEGRDPFFINVHLIPAPPEEDYALVYMWCEAWGCCSGRAAIEGREYTLILRDQNVNGSFGDIEGSGEGFDTVTLVPAARSGDDSEPLAQKLRNKMLLGGAALEVAVKAQGRKIVTAPVEVDFGTVAAPDSDIEVTLENAKWGLGVVPAGSKLGLPAGKWSVHSFRRVVKETKAFCKYLGPTKISIKVEPGKTVSLPRLETALTPEVIMRGKGKKKRSLSMVMTTTQGATFKDYRNPGAAKPLPGIPVKILDRSGRTVTEGYFPFG